MPRWRTPDRRADRKRQGRRDRRRSPHRPGEDEIAASGAALVPGLTDHRLHLHALAADRHPTGRLWRADDWLRTRLPSTAPPDLTEIGARLARFGVTAVTDATPDLDPTALDAPRRCGSHQSAIATPHAARDPAGRAATGRNHDRPVQDRDR